MHFSRVGGDVGYLRESYNGGPYATVALIPEDWQDQPEGGFHISAKTLRERLPAAVLCAIYRNHIVFSESATHPAKLTIEELPAAMMKGLAEADRNKRGEGIPTPNAEQLHQVELRIAQHDLPDYA